jgi:hypothetical protein
VDVKAVNGQSGAESSGLPAGIRSGRTARLVGVAAALTAAVISLTSCAVGQHAATAIDKPAVAGTGGKVGSMDLQNVTIQAPNVAGRDTGTKFYAAGDNAAMSLTLINVGHAADTLVSVTSTTFSSYTIVDTAALTQPTAGGASSQVINANESVGLGLTNLGVGTGSSAQTLVLTKASKQVFPGSTVAVTFTFATAGSITLQVPVNLTRTPTTGSIAPVSGEAGA